MWNSAGECKPLVRVRLHIRHDKFEGGEIFYEEWTTFTWRFNVAIWLKPRNTFSKVLTNRSSNSFKLSDEIWECGVKHEWLLWGEDYANNFRLPPQTTLFSAYQLTAETKTNAWHVTSSDRNTFWLTAKPKKAHETRVKFNCMNSDRVSLIDAG